MKSNEHKALGNILMIFIVIFCLFSNASRAHIEGVLFIEHPPKTTLGLRVQSSFYAINNHRFALTTSPFAEYAPSNHFSVGAGFPTGFYEGSYLFSDVMVAAKGNIPVKNFKIIPVVSSELPTGTEPATANHTEFVGAIFLEKKIPNWHFYGYPGVRFAFGDQESHHGHHEHGRHNMNVFKPHTDQELFLNAGISYWVTKNIGLDGRTTTYYENFNSISPKFQVGGVFQKETDKGQTLKASIDGFYVPNGAREGYGGGLSLYMAF